MRNAIEKQFPKLANSNWELKSPQTDRYNCIAWAAKDDRNFWWPNANAYWPPGIPCEVTLEAFIQAFGALGFSLCKDPSLEPGVEKVAIFINPRTGRPTHGARQLPSGAWTSKLGRSVDIEHELKALEGMEYGVVAVILAK